MNQPHQDGSPASGPKRDDFDITSIDWKPQDKWDRLYRNVVLAVLVVGIAVGLYFKA